MRRRATDRYTHSKHKFLLLNRTASVLFSPKLLVLDMLLATRESQGIIVHGQLRCLQFVISLLTMKA